MDFPWIYLTHQFYSSPGISGISSSFSGISWDYKKLSRYHTIVVIKFVFIYYLTSSIRISPLRVGPNPEPIPS